MRLIGSIDLPHGVQLPTGVNLHYEELESSQALEGAEELWSYEEFPENYSRKERTKN